MDLGRLLFQLSAHMSLFLLIFLKSSALADYIKSGNLATLKRQDLFTVGVLS